MKTLYLIRHAKSSWENPGLHDYERPLLEKGIKRTEKILQFLKNRKINPGIIVSSHTVRALETAKLIADGLGYPDNKISVESKLYFDGTDGIMNVVFALPNKKGSAIIIGHNPYITQFSNRFLIKKIEPMPTSGVVSIDFFTNKWNEVPLSEKNARFIIYPKDL